MHLYKLHNCYFVLQNEKTAVEKKLLAAEQQTAAAAVRLEDRTKLHARTEEQLKNTQAIAMVPLL